MNIASVFLIFLSQTRLSTCGFSADSKAPANDSNTDKNVLGDRLEICSLDPLTGWFRDGYCRTGDQDHGVHVVCATVTENFLAFTKSRGNDLSSRRGGFPGLSPGDSWCLCAARWKEAFLAGAAPLVNLRATHLKETLICSFHLYIFNFILIKALIAFLMQFCAETDRRQRLFRLKSEKQKLLISPAGSQHCRLTRTEG